MGVDSEMQHNWVRADATKTFERSQILLLTGKHWPKTAKNSSPFMQDTAVRAVAPQCLDGSRRSTHRKSHKTCWEHGTPWMRACTFAEADESPEQVRTTTPNRLQHCQLQANTVIFDSRVCGCLDLCDCVAGGSFSRDCYMIAVWGLFRKL